MATIERPGSWDYAPAPESTAIVSLRERYGLWIGGRWVEPRDGGSFATVNPATEEPLAIVAEGGAAVTTRRSRLCPFA